MADIPESISVSADGFSLPTSEVMTGRGFVTGKSGSGKSNSASVIAEELLEHGLPLLIVDTDGEYYGLKSRYEVLHVGAGADCDATVGVEHAEKIAGLALLQNVPVILDISGYVEEAKRRELVRRVVEQLFDLGKQARKPFLVFVEELHEFLPETGKVDELANTLITIAKRGRKRGIGICGMSQRPAAVDKDYITQCDWIVWHRLTWENDKRVVSQMLGDQAAADIDELEDGEALLMTDWDDRVNRVRFRRKRTFDAGATPGLDDFETGSFSPVRTALISELADEEADLNAIDLDELTDVREVPAEPELEGEQRAGATGAGGEPDTTIEAAPADAVDDAEGDVVTIPGDAASGPTYVPPDPPGDDRFDPVWELGHLTAYLFGRAGRAVAGVVGDLVGVVVWLDRWARRTGRTTRDRVIRPAARELEDVAARPIPDRVVAAVVVALLAIAIVLLLVS